MRDLFDPPDPRRVSPGAYPLWDEALVLLNRDLAVTLPRQRPLRLVALPTYEAEEPEHVYVALANGDWDGNPLCPDSAEYPALALMAVADAAQETVVECLWQVWPLCAEHDLGMHPREGTGGCPGGARASACEAARPTSVRPWARSAPSSTRAASTASGGARADGLMRDGRSRT